MNRRLARFFSFVGALTSVSSLPAQSPSPDAVIAAIVKGVAFFHEQAAVHGGYVYRTSRDGSLREAEGIPGPDTIWIQPPGTPAVGEAFLDAWLATKDPACLAAARDTGKALALTQLHSGGWYYSGHFDAKGRSGASYRRAADGTLIPDPPPNPSAPAKGAGPSGKHGAMRTTSRPWTTTSPRPPCHF